MFAAKDKLFLIFLATLNTAAVVASEGARGKVNIIQIEACDSRKKLDAKCHSLSSLYLQSLDKYSRYIIRPGYYDFSRRKMEQAINSKIDSSAVNIIHASGYETIAVLNYMCNKYKDKYSWTDLSTQPTRPTIVILESPRVISDQYSLWNIFYPGLLLNIQQPILNDFNKIPDNIHIIIASNNSKDRTVSDIKQSAHKDACVLSQALQNNNKNVYHKTTGETYPVKNGTQNDDACWCELNLFHSTDYFYKNGKWVVMDGIGDIIESIIACRSLRKDTGSLFFEVEPTMQEGRSVRSKNFMVVLGNGAVKLTLAGLLAYLIYKTGVVSDYLRK